MILHNKIITAAEEHTDTEAKAEEVKRVYDFFLERLSTYPLLDDNFDEYAIRGGHVYNEEQGYLAYVNDMISMALRMNDLYKDLDFSTSDLIRLIVFARIGTMGFVQQGPYDSLADLDTRSQKFIRSGFTVSDVTLYTLQRLGVTLTLREFDALRGRENPSHESLSSLASFYQMLEQAALMNAYNEKFDGYVDDLDDGSDIAVPGVDEDEEKPWNMAKPLPDIEDAPKTEEERKHRDKKREDAKKSFDKQAEKNRKAGKAAADFDELFGNLFEDQNLGE